MTQTGEYSEVEFRSHLRVLWRRKWAVAMVASVLVATAVGLSLLQKPVYQGTVKVLLQPRDSELLFDAPVSGDTDPARRIATEIEVMKSEPVRAAVRRTLGSPVPKASVVAVGSSDILELRVESTDRSRAAALASAYATSYVEYRRSQAVDDLNQAERKIEAKIADFQRQIDALDAQPSTGSSPSSGITATREHLVTQQALFKQRLDELQVDAELKTGGAQIVTRGVAPTKQVQPTPVKNGILALALGLVLGAGLAFLIEFLDDSIKTKDELERWADGTPVLGLLPEVDDWKAQTNPLLVTSTDSGSPAAEAYRSLRTSLQFLGVERTPRVFQITSANTGEGKTTTTANLGVVLARAGQRVAMVDCDLRRSRLHEFVGLSNQVGFTSVFVGNAQLSETVQPVPGVDNLFLLASGPQPPNQSELLGSPRTSEIFSRLQGSFDLVLVDCPPVLPVTDSAVLSAWVDATIVVARAGVTPRSDFRRALEMLRQVDAPLVGTVLSQVSAADGYGYRYGRYKSNVIPDLTWFERPDGMATRNTDQGAAGGEVVSGGSSGSANGGASEGRSRRPDVELR